MVQNIRKALLSMALEERILNSASIAAIAFLFFPWLSGQFLGGDPVSYSGTQFYVSYIGAAILLMHAAIVLIAAIPVLGGPAIVKKGWKHVTRLWLASHAAVLTLASLSVLTRVTYEFRGLEVRYGVYFSLVCSLIATLYAFLLWQEERHSAVHGIFHHPEDAVVQQTPPSDDDTHAQTPPPPPPPPPPPLEEHNLRI